MLRSLCFLCFAACSLLFPRGEAASCYNCTYTKQEGSNSGEGCMEGSMSASFLVTCPAILPQCWIMNASYSGNGATLQKISRMCGAGLPKESCTTLPTGKVCSCDTDGCNDGNTYKLSVAWKENVLNGGLPTSLTNISAFQNPLLPQGLNISLDGMLDGQNIFGSMLQNLTDAGSNTGNDLMSSITGPLAGILQQAADAVKGGTSFHRLDVPLFLALVAGAIWSSMK